MEYNLKLNICTASLQVYSSAYCSLHCLYYYIEPAPSGVTNCSLLINLRAFFSRYIPDFHLASHIPQQ